LGLFPTRSKTIRRLMNSGSASPRNGLARGTFPDIELLLSVHSWTKHSSNWYLEDFILTKPPFSLNVTLTDSCELQYSVMTVSAADILHHKPKTCVVLC
jgi:hypothetical protein